MFAVPLFYGVSGHSSNQFWGSRQRKEVGVCHGYRATFRRKGRQAHGVAEVAVKPWQRGERGRYITQHHLRGLAPAAVTKSHRLGAYTTDPHHLGGSKSKIKILEGFGSW